jgi:hypothetical protein
VEFLGSLDGVFGNTPWGDWKNSVERWRKPYRVFGKMACRERDFCRQKSVQKRAKGAVFVKRSLQKDALEMESESGEQEIVP